MFRGAGGSRTWDNVPSVYLFFLKPSLSQNYELFISLMPILTSYQNDLKSYRFHTKFQLYIIPFSYQNGLFKVKNHTYTC